MKTLYIECKMGAAGDMLTAALLELFENREETISQLNSMGITNVTFSAETVQKHDINGTHIHVNIDGHEENSEHHHHEHDHNEHHHHHHHHSHHSLSDIKTLINSLNVPEMVKNNGLQVYESLAKAEAKVHNTEVTDIHFHEVGTMDAVADVMAACYLLYLLKVDRVVVSPVHVGSGTVHCAHGILPVPAPATAELLKGLPIYGGSIESELCTPTGAALLRHFGSQFGDMPVMTISKIGYGMGKKDFPVANCVRVFLGETSDSTDQILELNCNIDDMTGEELGFALDAIYDAGAREVFFTHVQMKKNRPGTLLTAIVAREQKDAVVKAIFANTTTIGIREKLCDRYVLDREINSVDTPLGSVKVKKSAGYGTSRSKAEFDDLSKIAKEKGLTLAEVKSTVAPFINE